MHNAERYPFLPIDSALGEAGLQPRLPLTLAYQDQSVAVTGLLDTGAMVNVLPYPVGVDLGAVWEQQTTILRLTGNLAQFEARALLVSAAVGRLRLYALCLHGRRPSSTSRMCRRSGDRSEGSPVCTRHSKPGWPSGPKRCRFMTPTSRTNQRPRCPGRRRPHHLASEVTARSREKRVSAATRDATDQHVSGPSKRPGRGWGRSMDTPGADSVVVGEAPAAVVARPEAAARP